MPNISVLMGIYNCESTLADAIESILKQTYKDWELIMCDDGSSDSTYMVALQYQRLYSNKIMLVKNEENRGLNYTLNKCLSLATGKFIARMDGDDVCDPQRFSKEVAVLMNEPDIAIVSTDMTYFDETGTWGLVRHAEYPECKDFMKGSPFCHAPSLVRKEAFDAVGGYSESKRLLRVEDYHLWIKMYHAGYRGKNIHESLYQMRDDMNAYHRRKFRYRLNEAYVKVFAVSQLNLPLFFYVYALRPIIVGLLPTRVYDILHRRKLKVG